MALASLAFAEDPARGCATAQSEAGRLVYVC